MFNVYRGDTVHHYFGQMWCARLASFGSLLYLVTKGFMIRYESNFLDGILIVMYVFLFLSWAITEHKCGNKFKLKYHEEYGNPKG